MKICILVPVWRNYAWIAPITRKMIVDYWPTHPDLWFCGLNEQEGEGLPIIPLGSDADRSNWAGVLLNGVRGIREKGYDAVYLIAEEHIPVDRCHEEHLNQTIPGLFADLGASYISLMGWDNRRFTSKSPRLDKDRYRLQHLVAADDPRFHLHPALWRVQTLEKCCLIALRDEGKNGSAWHFEKECGRDQGDLHQASKGCYQICAASLSLHPRSKTGRLLDWFERNVFHKLMALLPLIPNQTVARRVWDLARFDDVFCNGPYPLFFSGIMAKGGLNHFFVCFLKRKNPSLLAMILRGMPKR
jgi:hypothetical protein